MTIETLTPESAARHLPGLVALLCDTVESGAAVGFMNPLSASEAESYWHKAIADLSSGSRLLLADIRGNRVAGSLQLELAMRTNGLHRAEVQKVMVHRDFRGQGIATQLMQSVETTARQADRSLLVLDTRQGDIAEGMYRKLGYIEAGVIPQYARSSNGELHSTVIFYKLLS